MTRIHSPSIAAWQTDQMKLDPINREDFNIHRGRQPNPRRIRLIEMYAEKKRQAESSLNAAICEAMESGHSFRQVANAAGVSVSVIQRIMSGVN